jgi:ABC-type antimicrobial peptide transport system permease subunit
LIVGSTAAEQWELSVGDQFVTTLSHSFADDQASYTVTGILDTNANVYYSRAFFLAVETYQQQTGKAAMPNTLFVYLKPDAKLGDIGILPGQIEGGQHLASTALKGGEYRRIAQTASNVFLVGLCSLSLYQSLQAILKNSARRIGLLKAMGMSDQHVTTIFVNGLLVVFALALILGGGLAGFAFYYLNRKTSEILNADIHLYHFNLPMFLMLLAMLGGTLLIVVGAVLYRTKRVPPRKAMLEI